MFVCVHVDLIVTPLVKISTNIPHVADLMRRG